MNALKCRTSVPWVHAMWQLIIHDCIGARADIYLKLHIWERWQSRALKGTYVEIASVSVSNEAHSIHSSTSYYICTLWYCNAHARFLQENSPLYVRPLMEGVLDLCNRAFSEKIINILTFISCWVCDKNFTMYRRSRGEMWYTDPPTGWTMITLLHMRTES